MRAATPRRSLPFQAALPETLAQEQQAHPEAEVELWAEDEHRLGLKPILRVLWAPRGQRPVVSVRPRYQWLWVVAFVCPESGETSFWLVPALTTEVFQLLLDAFARERGVGARKRILLVLDQAGWHASAELQAPEGLTLVFLPPYSPELQPAEHLWALLDAPVVNRLIGSLDELEAILGARVRVLAERNEQIRSTTLFHWWPRVNHQ
jgi:transposase